MSLFRTLAGTLGLLCALASASYAGPCTDDITRVEARISERLDAIAATGPNGVQDANAFGKHLQPTQRSIATAEEELGEMSQEQVAAIRSAMDRARAADAAGDKSACEQALGEVERDLSR